MRERRGDCSRLSSPFILESEPESHSATVGLEKKPENGPSHHDPHPLIDPEGRLLPRFPLLFLSPPPGYIQLLSSPGRESSMIARLVGVLAALLICTSTAYVEERSGKREKDARKDLLQLQGTWQLE